MSTLVTSAKLAQCKAAFVNALRTRLVIEPGSVGDDLEFDYWDILTAIDGKHYVDVQALYEDLKMPVTP